MVKGKNSNLERLKTSTQEQRNKASNSLSGQLVVKSKSRQKGKSPPAKGLRIDQQMIWFGDQYQALNTQLHVRVLGCQPFKQIHVIDKLLVKNGVGYCTITETTAQNISSKSHDVFFNRLYGGSHLPLSLYTSKFHWSLIGLDQPVKINTKLMDVTSLLSNKNFKNLYDQFTKHPWAGEKGVVKGMKVDEDSQIIMALVQMSAGSTLGSTYVPSPFVELIGQYIHPSPNKIIQLKDFWKNDKLTLPNLHININAIGGDGSSYFCNDRYQIAIRTNLDSTTKTTVKIGDFIYVFDNSFSMTRVRLNYIEDNGFIHVQQENKKIRIIGSNQVLAENCNVCVVWDALNECYVPVWFNELLGYNGHYMHAFDSDFNWDLHTWFVCLRDIRDGEDNWIWLRNDDLLTVFGSDWQSYGVDFMTCNDTIIQGDADAGSHSNSYLNQGEELLKLIKYFDVNESRIATIVENIAENGIDYCNVRAHKRFNEYGFAIKARNKGN